MSKPDRRQTETAALQDSEERFRLMIHAVKDYAIFMVDPQGRVTNWNEGAHRIKGYDAEEIIGRHFSIFYPEDALARGWPEHELQVAASEGSFEDEGWRIRKDGGRFWANVVITALRDDDGELIGFTKVTRDLTERRRHEEALRRSEERFRLMTDAVTDYAIFLLDPAGHISSWNDGARRIKGYAAEEVIGKHFSIFYPEKELQRGWPEYELKVTREQGRFEDEGWRLRKDGSRFWANVVITALWTDDDRLIGFTKVTRDLTERRKHEEELRGSEERLRAAYEEVRQRNSELQHFTRAASHDLQEPLRKLTTFADLLEMECGDTLNEAGRLYTESIRRSAERMSELVSDLLSYSRLAMRQMPLAPVDLNRVIDDTLDNLQVLLEETEGRVDRTPLPNIEADPIQLRQLFQNLIGNALKFHRPGVPPIVRVRADAATGTQTSQDAVTITVADNGIGFDEKYADVIFTPFHRLHPRSEYEGTGLGLAICRRIVQRYSGTISAHSENGNGAAFVVTLPVAASDEPPVSTQYDDETAY